MSPEAGGPIRQLAYTVDEAEAMELISLAVHLGATPDEARDAWVIWLQIRREDVATLHAACTCKCSHSQHIHDNDRCTVRACGCVRMRPNMEVAR